MSAFTKEIIKHRGCDSTHEISCEETPCYLVSLIRIVEKQEKQISDLVWEVSQLRLATSGPAR